MGTEIFVAVATTLIIGLGSLAYRMLRRGILGYLRDDIKSHLIPNGGSSLADRLSKVEQAVDKLTKANEETGCLPGCPMRGAWPHTGMPDHRTRGGGFYGSPPAWATTTQQHSPHGIAMPSFVAPT